MGPILIGSGVGQAGLLVDFMLASTLTVGGISALFYSNRHVEKEAGANRGRAASVLVLAGSGILGDYRPGGGMVVALLYQVWPGGRLLSQVLGLVLAVLLATATYLAANCALRLPETGLIFRIVRQAGAKLRRRTRS